MSARNARRVVTIGFANGIMKLAETDAIKEKCQHGSSSSVLSVL